jgi:hypothetical protein
MVCDDPDFIRIRESMLDFANNFHRVNECGRLLPSVNTGEQERPEK